MKNKTVVWVAALVALIGAGSWTLISQRRSAAAEAAKWKTIEAELRQKLAAAERQPPPATTDEPEDAPKSGAPSVSTRAPKVVVDDSTSRQALLQIIEDKDRQLSAAENSLRELQAKLQEVSTRLEQVQEQQTKLQESEVQLRARIDSMTQQAAAQEASVKARETRLAEVEQSNQELRRKTDDSTKLLSRLQQLAVNLEELARRREAYLTNILGRYREATDLFRTMSVRLEQPRENGVNMVGANDVSRIQNAISLAEEDMRQLRGLNTRATTLQKDLQAIGHK